MHTAGRAGYSAVQILLHWAIAALVIFQLLFGEEMTGYYDGLEEGKALSSDTILMGNLHYWFGIAILALVLLRLAVRLTAGAPAATPETPGWMVTVGHWSHWLFYALLAVVPLLGLAAFYIGDPFNDLHELSKPVFIVLIGLHVLASIYHQVVLRDGTLKRMVKPA